MAELVNPLSKIKITEEDPSNIKLNFAAFEEGSGQATMTNSDGENADSPKKRGRPAKPKTMVSGGVMFPAGNQTEELSMLQSNQPYASSFAEPMMLTRCVIADVDTLNGTVREQLDAVVESKTLRKKYDYISELSSTSANLMSTKLRGISELKGMISEGHKLDLQRAKELKLSTAIDDANDDKRMMDMYTAFINTPIGSYGGGGPQFPTMSEMTMPGGAQGIDMTVAANMASSMGGIDAGYVNWQQNMSPETNRMIIEKTNPNVQTVVVYDQTTNNKFFDVIDRTTGQSVPNVPRPDAFLLADTYPNLNNKTARNSNIDAVYPLVVVGRPETLNDF